jgi:hypothetical protein
MARLDATKVWWKVLATKPLVALENSIETWAEVQICDPMTHAFLADHTEYEKSRGYGPGANDESEQEIAAAAAPAAREGAAAAGAGPAVPESAPSPAVRITETRANFLCFAEILLQLVPQGLQRYFLRCWVAKYPSVTWEIMDKSGICGTIFWGGSDCDIPIAGHVTHVKGFNIAVTPLRLGVQ